jgi:hypothetical protein
MHRYFTWPLTKYGQGLINAAAVTAMVSMPSIAFSQSGEGTKAVAFSLVRTFSLPSLPAEVLQSELFRKAEGEVVMADIVDLNLEFSATHGKPEFSPPEMALKTQTLILRFPDGWWTLNSVRSDGKGAFICRVKAKLFEPKPDPKDFSKYVEWCHASLTLATLDAGLFEGSPPSP